MRFQRDLLLSFQSVRTRSESFFFLSWPPPPSFYLLQGSDGHHSLLMATQAKFPSQNQSIKEREITVPSRDNVRFRSGIIESQSLSGCGRTHG